MKAVFIALEDEQALLGNEIAVAGLFQVKPEQVTILHYAHQPQSRDHLMGGKLRNFRRLTDIYVWTCKYWYGLFESKLTYIRVVGVDQLSLFFTMKYSEQIRFAVAADRVSIFDKVGQNKLDIVTNISMDRFDEERIEDIRVFLPTITPHFKILSHYNNPF